MKLAPWVDTSLFISSKSTAMLIIRKLKRTVVFEAYGTRDTQIRLWGVFTYPSIGIGFITYCARHGPKTWLVLITDAGLTFKAILHGNVSEL